MLRLVALGLFVAPAFSALTGQQLVDYINTNGLFKATYHALGNIRHYGHISDPQKQLTVYEHTKYDYDLTVKIPEQFDSAENWPECADIINNIRDQSNCGCCWAVVSAGILSDRICIATKGKYKVSISSIATASCAGKDGCCGGNAHLAYNEFIKNGLPTGSEEGLNQGCQPYPFKHCNHGVNVTKYPFCEELPHIPEADVCSHKCQASYPKKYEDDLYFGKEQYKLQGEETIQREILKNGPLYTSFQVFDSFEYYSAGIYRSVPGEQAQVHHAMRIVGWGVENGTKYWKIANVWNDKWGEKGFVRFIRGIDDCGVESNCAAVTVDTDHLPKN
ncbi:unnamed protein product [Bursaphelenchus xylophilus]|uniref:(pine wood nematode) hypothetical protein n=1 Tax=Bursaphelenchus xylophilus TaxID=6326 RepID=A0A1I7S6M9_BURXY|nr:unnamed protein product [Bursaphelenchus xylophilus]CAG9120593.1 unnamed protein product [Bursaphelenchus xylophilus]